MQFNKERILARPQMSINTDSATEFHEPLTDRAESPHRKAWRRLMTTTEQKLPIRVFVEGMNERMKNTLRFFFQGPCKNDCILAGEDSADLGLFDLDGYQGRKQMQAYRDRHPGQPLILLSLHDEKVENAIHLRKPIKPERLISALQQARVKRQRQPVSAPATKPAPQPYRRVQTKAPKPVTGNIKKAAHRPDLISNKKPHSDQHRNRAAVTASPPRPETHKAAMYLDEQEAHAYIGSAPELDLNDAQQLANAQYNPAEFIQGHLRKAAKAADKYKSAVELKMPYCSIAVLPKPILF